jgi:hypothetical protein
MNRVDMPFSGGEAQIRYLDGDFQIISNGSHVVCAVTGATIPLDELRYWNVDRQEPYVDAEASLRRHLQIVGRG